MPACRINLATHAVQRLHRHQTDSLTTSTATHAIQQITGVPGATQKDDIYYCIKWDLRSATNKTVELTARAKGKRTNTVRTWTPENEELNKYWDVPLRAVFTYWSNKHIVEWSGEGPIQASSGLSSSNASWYACRLCPAMCAPTCSA